MPNDRDVRQCLSKLRCASAWGRTKPDAYGRFLATRETRLPVFLNLTAVRRAVLLSLFPLPLLLAVHRSGKGIIAAFPFEQESVRPDLPWHRRRSHWPGPGR